jgi:uncharacterized membrane protein
MNHSIGTLLMKGVFIVSVILWVIALYILFRE